MPRHDLDPLSLMAGIFFVGVALLGLLGQGTGDAAGWLWPALLIVVGLAGLLAARPRPPAQQPSASDPLRPATGREAPPTKVGRTGA